MLQQVISYYPELKARLISIGDPLVVRLFDRVYSAIQGDRGMKEKLEIYVCELQSYLWEALHILNWKDVNIVYRDAYSLSAAVLVLCDMDKNDTRNEKGIQNLLRCIKIVDMGLLLGSEFMRSILTEIAAMLQKKDNSYKISEVEPLTQIKRKRGVFCPNSPPAFVSTPIVMPVGPGPSSLSDPLPRVSAPPLNDFYKEYLMANRPTVLTVAGSRLVPVETGKHYLSENAGMKLMTLSEFIDVYILNQELRAESEPSPRVDTGTGSISGTGSRKGQGAGDTPKSSTSQKIKHAKRIMAGVDSGQPQPLQQPVYEGRIQERSQDLDIDSDGNVPRSPIYRQTLQKVPFSASVSICYSSEYPENDNGQIINEVQGYNHQNESILEPLCGSAGPTQSVPPTPPPTSRPTELNTNRQKVIGYLAQHTLFDQIPELRADFDIPDYCALLPAGEASHDVVVNAWLGPHGTVSPLHHDPFHNLLVQVVGYKIVRLYSPVCSQGLYPMAGKMCNNSSVDLLHYDEEKYPLFASMPYSETVLCPGDTLFIPRWTWHFVMAVDGPSARARVQSRSCEDGTSGSNANTSSAIMRPPKPSKRRGTVTTTTAAGTSGTAGAGEVHTNVHNSSASSSDDFASGAAAVSDGGRKSKRRSSSKVDAEREKAVQEAEKEVPHCFSISFWWGDRKEKESGPVEGCEQTHMEAHVTKDS